MADPILSLMAEHRLIEEVLASLGGFAMQAQSGANVRREAVARYADFFSQFADRSHHGKEEDLVFSRMVQRGIPAEDGPIAVMLAEHVQGRSCVEALRTIGEGSGPLSDEEKKTLHERASEYVDLLRNHISKEDRVLFPIAIRVLETADMANLEARFAEFEAKEVESGEFDRLRSVARGLMTEYPPAWSTGASCEACAGCGAGTHA